MDIRCVEIKNRKQAEKELNNIGCDRWGAQHMAGKAVFKVLKLKGVTPTQANIIKQEMLSVGGEAAVSRGVVNHSVAQTDMLMMATETQYKRACAKFKMQPFKLKQLAEKIERVLNNIALNCTGEMDCRGKKLSFGARTLVMGILNVTPDSFSDGGRFNRLEQALEHAEQMVNDGADIIDIGGESTRPGYTAVTLTEELERVVPVVERLANQLKVPISVDTTKAEVAKQALAAGAHIINDIWAGQADTDMFSVAAQFNAPVMLMHNRQGTEYRDLMFDLMGFLTRTAKQALDAGVPEDKIIIDPGIGFGKTYQQNLEVMRRLDQLKSLGYPILLGTSRKSLIADTLNLPVDQRVEGTAATVVLGITKGVDIVRVHDVKEMARVCRMADAIVRGEWHG